MEIKKEFKKGLEEMVNNYVLVKDGEFYYTNVYVDRNDDYSHLVEYLDLGKSKEENIWILEDLIFEYDYNYYEYHLDYVREGAKEIKIEGFQEFIEEMIAEGMIYVNYNPLIEAVFEEEIVFNIMLSNYEERNYEYMLLRYFADNLIEGQYEEAINILKNTGLNNLLSRQGYTAEELVDGYIAGKENNFLNSIIEELDGVYSMGELIIVNKMIISDYFDLIEGKKDLIIEKDAIVGIADIYHGGGSYLGIELEKDFKIKGEEIYPLDSRYWRKEENKIQIFPDEINGIYGIF